MLTTMMAFAAEGSSWMSGLDFSSVTNGIQDIAVVAIPAVLAILGIKKGISFAQKTIKGA